MKVCSKCEKLLSDHKFHKNKSSYDGLANWCIVCFKAYRKSVYYSKVKPRNEKRKDVIAEQRRVRMYRLRLEAIKKLGGKCSCCEESREPCLNFDHIEDDGKIHRTFSARAIGVGLYLDLIAGKHGDRIQILCANCHAIKSRVSQRVFLTPQHLLLQSTHPVFGCSEKMPHKNRISPGGTSAP